MAFVILQTATSRSAGRLNGLTPIGRRLANAVVIPHPAVSRLHAWIEPHDGQYILRDAGSRTGTFLNDEPVVEPATLREGDTIRVGPATLVFHETSDMPRGIVPLDFGPHPGTDPGIFFSCSCGQLIWAASALATRKGQCLSCNAAIVVPRKGAGAKIDGAALPLPGRQRALVKTAAPPAAVVAARQSAATERRLEVQPARLATASTPARAGGSDDSAASSLSRKLPVPGARPMRLCSICQSPLHPSEPTHACPECKLVFHEDCWIENRGCSAYGCSQVNVLAPARGMGETSDPLVDDNESAEGRELSGLSPDVADEPIPWHLFLLASCGFAFMLSALSFGIPSIIAAVATTVYILRTRSNHPAVAALSLGLCALGVFLGIIVSAFWWYDVPFSRWIM